jgi:multimeric flavodoxin WrbA
VELLISGSPFPGRCDALATRLAQELQQQGSATRVIYLSQKHIAPCRGCNSCSKTGQCVLLDNGDDWQELEQGLADCEALTVVAPVYFAGPPAQLKALIDRFQVFWARRYALGQAQELDKIDHKKPAKLYVLHGAGTKDTHGFEPLVGILRSGLAIAGFELLDVL